jgi:hypothetical protein
MKLLELLEAISDIRRRLGEIDPSRNKSYTRWLLTMYNKGQIQIDDDNQKTQIYNALMDFDRAKNSRLLMGNTADIFRYPTIISLYEKVKELNTILYNAKSPTGINWTCNNIHKKINGNSYNYYLDCNSDIHIPIKVYINIQPGNLAWIVSPYKNIQRIKKKYRGTGLMKIIIPAIYNCLKEYLAERQPNDVAIIGGDIRIRLYQSWAVWQFPGYYSKKIEGGVVFQKSGISE